MGQAVIPQEVLGVCVKVGSEFDEGVIEPVEGCEADHVRLGDGEGGTDENEMI